MEIFTKAPLALFVLGLALAGAFPTTIQAVETSSNSTLNTSELIADRGPRHHRHFYYVNPGTTYYNSYPNYYYRYNYGYPYGSYYYTYPNTYYYYNQYPQYYRYDRYDRGYYNDGGLYFRFRVN